MTASDQEIAVHRSVTVPLPRESALAARFARGRFRPEQVNAVGVAELRGCSPRELLDRLHDHQEPRGLTAGFGGRVALVDGMIHSRTSAVRWAGCGRSRRTGCSRLCRSRGSLHRSARRRARGLRLGATDLGWSAGSGPELRGPAEPLLMAMAGRRGVAHELTGPGLAVLAARS
jgi:hypothetical protein